MGKGCRAFNLKDPSRGQRWKEIVKENPSFKISILKEFSSQSDAVAFEKEKIIELRPDGNTHGIVRFLRQNKGLGGMDIKEFARLGAEATNKLLTKEGRSKAAKKGWRRRKKKV